MIAPGDIDQPPQVNKPAFQAKQAGALLMQRADGLAHVTNLVQALSMICR